MSLLERVMRVLAHVLYQDMTESESRCNEMVSRRVALCNRQCDVKAFKTTLCELYYGDYEPVAKHLALTPGWDPTTDLVSPNMCDDFEIMIRTCRAVRHRSLSFQSRGLVRFLQRMHHMQGTWEQLRIALCDLHSSVMTQCYVQQLQLAGLERRITGLKQHCFDLRILYMKARFVVAHEERRALAVLRI